jgi:hypothetical protein
MTNNLRTTILRVYVALACLSCVRSQPNVEQDASPAKPSPATVAEAAAAPAAPPHSGPVVYEDKSDLPENAGDKRCKDAPAAGAKPASVSVELGASPARIELNIPSLSVQQRMWTAAGTGGACRASLADGEKAIRFHCSDDAKTIDAKIYSRRSDIVVGRMQTAGEGTTRFVLPCGTPAKMEPIVCPKECKKEGDACTCGTEPKK